MYAAFAFGRENWSWTQRTKAKRRDVGRLPYKNVQYGQEDMGADGPALWMKRLQKVCGGPWDGFVIKSNAVIYSLKKVYKWRSTRWWHSLQTRMMKNDSENHTRWKHKWRWHNRGHTWREGGLELGQRKELYGRKK